MENKIKAINILSRKFNQQFIEGNRDAIFNAVKVLSNKVGINVQLRQQFTYIINNKWNLPPEDIKRIVDLLEQHEPREMKELIDQFVINAPNNGIRKNQEYVDLAEEKVRRMAQAFKEKNINEWYNFLQELQEGDQRQTFNFANEIGKTWPNKEEVINLALKALTKIPLKNQNSSFIDGLVSGVNEEQFTRSTIDKILSSQEIAFHSIRLNRFLSITVVDIEKLYPLFKLYPNYIVALQYIKFDVLTNNELNNILSEFVEIGDYGKWLSIDILADILRSDEKKLNELTPLAKLIIQQKGILRIPPYDQLSLYNFQELIKKLLADNTEKDLAIFLTEEIILACGEPFVYWEYYEQEIFFYLLENYWEVTWPLFGNIILKKINYTFFNLKNLLSNYKNFDANKLFSWAKDNLPSAPIYLMLFVEIETQDENGAIIFSEIVRKLLDNYGSNKRMLNELSARLHSYSAVGSTIPIFESRIALLSSLLNHPNEEVKIFANQEIEHFKSSIEKEKIFIQNYSLGEI